MNENRPRVILLEENDAVLQSANAVLSTQGWDVTCEQDSKKALAILKASEDGPFALFISSFKLPNMEGDDILKRVKTISPVTQRMLMVCSDEPDILISAINKAKINACITAPFKEEDLVRQTRNCFRQFRREVKRRRLERITIHQNRQMFKIARKLKKKDSAYEKQVSAQKNRLLKLNARIREMESKKHLKTDISVSSYIDHRSLQPSPEMLQAEFTQLCGTVHSVINHVCTQKKMPPVPLDLNRIFKSRSRAETDTAAVTGAVPDTAAGTPDKGVGNEPGQDTVGTAGLIIKYALAKALQRPAPRPQIAPEPEAQPDESGADPLDQLFNLRISDSQTRAYIQRKSDLTAETMPTISDILDWLSNKMISYGILDDDAIETWLEKSAVDEIIIAEGEDPVFGSPGVVTYQFETEFTNPGKISEDGSIDFRDRGDIPFITAGTLMAQKKPAKQGTAGISLSSIPIPVEEVEDPVFAAGTGVRLSEDGLEIYADIDGQPHVDAMGTVSVLPELVIQGDVDFETGNIDFNGNIIVKGMVKEGFTVKGINLTAQEIEGAVIDLSGDLNVSAGINDAAITVQGNIYAKFLNNSKVMGFGDLCISKEIIDSTVLISGACNNETGHIISSRITAKLGVAAGNIGTASSKPSQFIVGVDEHVRTMAARIDESLEASVNKSNLLKDDIKALEDEDQALYEQISEKAHVQDRSQLEIKELKKSLPGLEQSNDMGGITRVNERIKALDKKAKQAEEDLNAIFEHQDSITARIGLLKNKVAALQTKNKDYVLEKRALKTFSAKNRPLAQLTVSKTISQDTVVKGPHVSKVLKEDRSRCRILEMERQEGGVQFFEMLFSDL